MIKLFKRVFTSKNKEKEPTNSKEALKALKDQQNEIMEIQKEHAKKMGEIHKKRAETAKKHSGYLEKRRQTAKKHAKYLDAITPAKKNNMEYPEVPSHRIAQNSAKSYPKKKSKSPNELALIDAFDSDKKSASPDSLLRNEFDEVAERPVSPATKLMREMMLIDEFDGKKKSKPKPRSPPKKGGSKTMKKRRMV